MRFVLPILYTETSAKGPFLCIFPSRHSPLVAQILRERARETDDILHLVSVITVRISILCVGGVLWSPSILIYVATSSPYCLKGGSPEVYWTWLESGGRFLLFSGVCTLASVNMHKLSNNQ